MKIPQSQSDALGGCQECQSAATTPTTSQSAAPPAVLIADPDKPDWIALELRTPSGKPVPNEAFSVELPGGKRVAGKLDNLGRIRIEGVDPGSCKVSFPERDAKEWKKR